MLPQKLFFRIGEVAGLVGVEPHVLRYWEREFRSIRPTKSAKGQRVYSRKDVENLLRVRDLLYRDGFTIAGAKKKLQRGVEDARLSKPDIERTLGLALEQVYAAMAAKNDWRAFRTDLLFQFQLAVSTRLAASDNSRIGRFAASTGGSTLGRLALRRHGMTATLGSTFTTTVRVVNGVHGCTAHVRTTPHPPLPPGFAQHDCIVIGIASLADGCSASAGDTSNLTTGEHQLRPIGFACHQRRQRAGAAAHSGSAARLHLDAEHLGSRRHALQRHAVAHFGGRIAAVLDFVTSLQTIGSDDVALFAVGVDQQGNATGSIGIVLDRVNFGWNAIFVAFEVNHAILLFVTTAAVAGGDFALKVAATLFRLGSQQRLFRHGTWRQLSEIAHRRISPAGGSWFVFANTHRNYLVFDPYYVCRVNLADAYCGRSANPAGF